MPTKVDTKRLCKSLGRKPFDDRANFNGSNYAKCPNHNGDGDKTLHLIERDGQFLATCFSVCAKTWDAIGFVRAVDNLGFMDAVRKLGGKEDIAGPAETPVDKPKPVPPKVMTLEAWANWGRDIIQEDVTRLAANRKDKTPSLATFKSLGCRVQGDYIGFPNTRTTYDSDGLIEGVKFDCVRKRHLDNKEFFLENSVSQHGLFNLDTVNALDDVYVVEGEIDVAVMEEAGFRAVSVISGSQKKFDRHALETIQIAPRIFLVGDQGEDDPGQKCMAGLQKLLPLEKTFRIQFENAKDVSELARKTGENFAAQIIQLTEESLEPWVTENLPTITQLSSEPVKWVVERMFPYGGLTMLAGSQGSMKSLFGMYAAQAITTNYFGRGFLGRKVLDGIPVLYIDRENPEGEVSNRARLMGIMGNRNFIYWGDFNKGEQTPEIDDPRLLEFAHRRNGYIIFDSLQDWYGDESEIDNTAMVKLMGKFRKLARAGAGVLLLHHQNKSKDATWRGGTAIISLTDMAIAASKSADDQNVVQLREARFRMCGAWEIDFKAHWDAGERHDRAQHYQLDLLRDQFASEVVREEKAKLREKVQARTAKDNADAGKVLEAIKADPGLAPSTLESKTGVRRTRVVTLAGDQGLTWDKEIKRWQGEELEL
jgi:hypothetical protein